MSFTVEPISFPLMPSRENDLEQCTRESNFRAATKDEKISICQIIEEINDRLFDEYRSELLAYRQEISLPRRYA